ncbi:hypothetical protein HUB98_19910 [Paenibacillus barcinonensis]|uniref:Uncharacterized protein n=1 Tax=Paenibacillus barcinonensis TaxID=198119 RepID=A0A2V4VZ62_PAEBA|nr:hypothetical protein [Paenibacillus barcinonensis]PYE47398.1 hypothetical protein DFQ00_114140 [Paenibacillus barcinonensis]QKS58284.1 hypothetical protein HUB98_19910 [Paenibacillus barcinonensis]
MFQHWLNDLSLYPDTTFILLGVLGLLLAVYLWSATEIRRSHARRMQSLRDTLYISTGLLGQLAIWEQRNHESNQQEHNELLKAMHACKSASYLSPQLQDQIRDCIKDHDTARIALMHKALERECTALSEELSRSSHSLHWGRSLWTIIRPAAEPVALAATALLLGRLVNRLQREGIHLDSWQGLLPWIQSVSLMLTIVYGYLLWASTRRGTSGTLIKWLSLLIALCSLLHLIGLEAAPYVLALQLILFASGFSLTGSRSRSERPYAGHTDSEDISSVNEIHSTIEPAEEEKGYPDSTHRAGSDKSHA